MTWGCKLRRLHRMLTLTAMLVQSMALMPRDSLAEIMAAEQVLAAKQQLHTGAPAARFGGNMWGHW